MRHPESQVDLSRVREILSGARGQDYWRSLEQVADLPEVLEMMNASSRPARANGKQAPTGADSCGSWALRSASLG